MSNLTQDTERKATHEWMMEVKEAAWADAKAGNLNPLNALGKHSCFSRFIAQTQAGIPAEHFARQFPQDIQEAEVLRREYELLEAAPENDKRLTALEEAFKQLPDLLKSAIKSALTESEDTGGDGSDPDAGHAPATPAVVPAPTPPAPPAKPVKAPKTPAAPATPPAPVVPPVETPPADEGGE